MNEIWRPFPGFEEGYLISNYGKVYSLRNKKLLKPIKTKNGYLRIHPSIDGFRKDVQIHRAVAQAFIPNPENKPTVNHINEIKTDNFVGNLEWATMKDQNNHGTRTKRAIQNTDWIARTKKMDYKSIAAKHDYKNMNNKQKKTVIQLTEDGFFVAEFESISSAARKHNIRPSHICCCLKGRRKTCAGFRWKYA